PCKGGGEIGAELIGAGEESEGMRLLRFDREIGEDWLQENGHVPLPPYIRRDDLPADGERYQTVYAREPGSAAAPTAGLHFTRELLADIEAAGIESAFVTLHVGLGTFLPVRAADIEDHRMHAETFRVTPETARRVTEARAAGRKVVAVGTTSVRALESAWRDGELRTGEFDTSIFIRPGYEFRAVDAVFTNFHTPESTLLMLVAAFAGREPVLETYAEAVREGYRFFSYGDAMLIHPAG
ncbi:MAG: tRNA preQ1(34) S-adenosylmethionine ribosyltransferase-isomerase QueA, partial [Treponema sp.]|nr:tRNA preQ1(34) S-adenosylmethionine ribosyltransferase-isomerase QueA [Treponema sp.]